VIGWYAPCSLAIMARDTIPPESGVWPDRRAHRRAELCVPALVDARHSYATGRCLNVSEGGVSVELERPLPAGTRVDVYFELPTGVAIDLEAEVVRANGTDVGMRFVAPEAAVLAALERYVNEPAEPRRLAVR
jgi:hypothetical protein